MTKSSNNCIENEIMQIDDYIINNNNKGALMFIENALKLDDYIRLKEEAFGGVCHRQAAQASLDGSTYVLHVEVDGKTIGMARIIGDGGFVNYLADMIVATEYQGKGIGSAIMERILSFVQSNILDGGQTMIDLAAAKGKEGFYEKYGFKSRPNDREGHGMQLRLKN
ncbi:MAG: GNAT family N-acetyltransferase [Clostridiales bacterium]|nr:GNAT family N-acetyltransferase [Clostridiales bacterium]